MKLRLIIGALAIVPVAGAASLELDGPAFAVPGLTVAWKAPTNHWPSRLWIYKVLPQQFSPTVVSNLMNLGGFTASDRTHIEGQPPFKDKRLQYFANKERTRHLGIFPPLGWLYYRDERAAALGKKRMQGVPSEAEAIRLGRQHMAPLGIATSDLVTREGSDELLTFGSVEESSWTDRKTGEPVKEVRVRGVSFVRRLDGVSMTGRGSDGGFSIRFGSEGKVMDLELVWRNLQRHESQRVIPPAEIMERVRQGQARMVPLTAIDPAGAKKLTINKIVPYYLGAGGEREQDYVFPFAVLECLAEMGGGNTVGVVLKCPVLAKP